MKKLFLLLVMVLLPLGVNAEWRANEYVFIDGLQYQHLSNYQAILTYIPEDYSGDLVIPSQVEYDGTTCTVVSVSENRDRKGITSITIPSTIYSLCNWDVFRGCTSVAKVTYHCTVVTSLGLGNHVKEVILGSEVKEISDGAFQNWAISSITIPESVDTIRAYAFYGCTSLTSIDFPDGVKCIADNAFGSCTGLTEISFSETVDSIGIGAFGGCNNLKYVALPTKVRSIGHHAFSECTGLTEVKLPERFEKIGEGAFASSGLTAVTIPDTWEAIPASLFEFCYNLTKIDFGKGVKSIGEHAFRYSQGPARLHIPPQVTSIGGGAFYACDGILEVYTGDGLTEIENGFLVGCSPKSITISPNVTRLAEDAIPAAEVPKIFWLPETPPEGYQDHRGWYNYVPNEKYQFEEEYQKFYPKLKEMFEHDGVLYIPLDNDSCDAVDCIYDEEVQTVVIPKNVSNGGSSMKVKNINPALFNYNPFVQDVTIEADVPLIPWYSFDGCSSLKRFTITDRESSIFIESVPKSSIEYFYLGANAKIRNRDWNSGEYEDWNGDGCLMESLKELVIGDSVTSIALVPRSPNLTRLEIGRNLYNMGGSFKDCTGLTNIICKASVPPAYYTIYGNWHYDEVFFSEDIKASCQVQVPEENLAAYKKAETWKDFSQIVGGDFKGDQILVDHVWYKLYAKNKTAEALRVDDYEYDGEVEIKEEVSRDGINYVVNSIYNDAFCDCQALSIVIPKTISNIGRSAFARWNYFGPYNIVCHLEKPIEVDKWSFGRLDENYKGNISISKCKNFILYVPKGSKSLFEESEYWNRFSEINDEYDGEVFVDSIRYRINKSTQIAELYLPFDEYRPNSNGYRPTSVVIPATVSDGSLSYSVQAICDLAFYEHGQLTSVTFPSTIKKICRGAFGRTPLTALDLPDGVEEIGDYAFYDRGAIDCNTISQLIIPASVKSIGEYAFSFCSGELKSVTSYLVDPFDIDVSTFAINYGNDRRPQLHQNNATLYVPKGTKEKYQALTGWNDYFLDIQEMEEEIETAPVTISGAKQVPYCSDKNLDFTDKPDLKAYVATGYDKTNGTIWLTRVMQVPAETGFLLIGDPGDYDIPTIDGVSDVYYKNMFKGTLTGTTIYTTEGEYTNYYLSKGTSGVGFYKVTNENGQKIGANRCYLPILTDIPANGAEGDAEVIKVSAAKQVPYYTSKNIDFSTLDAQGVKAYTATGYNYGSGVIWLTRVKKVPAQTGILVMAEKEGEYSVPTTSVQSVYENMFTGSETAQTIYTTEEVDGITYINYYLSNGESGVGFYKVTKEDGVSMGANRSYLQIPKRDSAAGARGMYGNASFSKMIISDNDDDVIAIPVLGDDTTGIEVQSSIFNVPSNDVYYNLQGQRVENPGKGVYIRNGKKVVVR